MVALDKLYVLYCELYRCDDIRTFHLLKNWERNTCELQV